MMYDLALPPVRRARCSPLRVAPPSSPHPCGRDLATILIVDDNPAALQLARITLVERGALQCRLECAASGEAALARLRAAGAAIDLVLLDINMPRLDGFQVLREIRASDAPSCPPVVMCSASSDHRDIAHAHASGAHGHIEKPPSLANLRPLLRSLGGLTFTENDQGAALLRAA